jgi:hypothetical protein
VYPIRWLLFGLAVALAAYTEPSSDSPVRLGCRTAAYPAPEWSSAAISIADTHTVCVSDAFEDVSPLRAEIKRLGFAVKTKGGCGLALDVALGGVPSFAGLPPDWQHYADGYAWVGTPTNQTWSFTIYALSPDAAHYAVHALLSLISTDARTVPQAAADWPRFTQRGVIEGFYNRYFTAKERSTTLQLMHELRQNVYFYAPKDDVYAGYKWWEPYPANVAAQIASSAHEARSLGIDFVFGISPTLSTNAVNDTAELETSFRFTSSDDYWALVAKLESIEKLGVSRFPVQFDDVAGELYHPEDRARFATMAQAHVDLANRLVARFGSLIFVGSVYTAQTSGWQDYVQEIGASLDPSIRVMWTGPNTFSSTMVPADLEPVNQLLGRQVSIWDNWPTEAMPVSGRDPQLYTATEVMLTNATLVGDIGHPVADFWKVLGSIGAYNWSPTTYSADSAYADWQPILTKMLACQSQ